MDKQREKLIELINNAPKIPCIRGGRATGKNFQTTQNIADHLLADEEIKHAFELLKAEKEGRLIVPPCKVGDVVYFVCLDENCEKFIDKGKVYAISQNENTLWFSVRYLSGLRYDHTADDFGKTVFLSREDAEKALKNGG